MNNCSLLASSDQASAGLAEREYVLRLYVAGTTPRSTDSILSVQRICDAHLGGRYRLEVVDIYQQPALAKDGQVVAVPTLVRCQPAPGRRLIGDLSNSDRVLAGLGLQNRHGVGG